MVVNICYSTTHETPTYLLWKPYPTKKKRPKVEKFDQELRQLVANILEALENHNGIGLAAPQINRSLRLFHTKVPTPPDDKWEEDSLPCIY